MIAADARRECARVRASKGDAAELDRARQRYRTALDLLQLIPQSAERLFDGRLGNLIRLKRVGWRGYALAILAALVAVGLRNRYADFPIQRSPGIEPNESMRSRKTLVSAQYWCAIKHSRQMPARHDRYKTFAEFGDARSYGVKKDRLRRRLGVSK